MLNQILLYLGSALPLLWGAARAGSPFSTSRPMICTGAI
jgi:hypothetical protein